MSFNSTSTFPGFDHIYCMKHAYDGKRFYGDPERSMKRHTELFRGEWVPEAPIKVCWAMELPNPEDVAFGRSTAWYYLSPRVQEFFNSEKLTGWSTYPISLYNKAGVLCPGYVGLSITGRCGPTDQQGGEVVPGQRPGKKNVRRIGLYFDESTWDGSDFFCPEGVNTYMFATERAKNLFEKHKIEGFDFSPLSTTTWYPKVS